MVAGPRESLAVLVGFSNCGANAASGGYFFWLFSAATAFSASGRAG